MTAPVQAPSDVIPAEVADPAGVAAATRADAVADARARGVLYGRVSRTAAAERDMRVAVGAAWTADLHQVQALLWERAPAATPVSEPVSTRFLAVATAVGLAVSGGSREPGEAPASVRDAREVVVAARRRLLGVFDPPAAALVAQRLQGLEHLAELPVPGGSLLPQTAASLWWRARELPAGALPAHLRGAASDGRVVADALIEAGYRRDAARQVALADVAEVEAYLVEASVAVGDVELLLADVRRAALVFVLSELAERPGDVTSARATVWAAARAALPAAETARLAGRLGRGPEARPEPGVAAGAEPGAGPGPAPGPAPGAGPGFAPGAGLS